MCIALVGGMERLEKHYLEEGERAGVDLRAFYRSEVTIGPKIRNLDTMVIFTNKVSHRVKAEAVNAAKANSIPVFMHHA